MVFPISHLGPLGIGLLWAMVCDLRSRRIPNLISGSVFVTGLVACGVDGGVRMILSGLAAFMLLGIAIYPAWRAGGIGGGDLKLAAATGIWVGLPHLLWFVLATAVAGGIVAAVCYLVARAPARAEVRANLMLAALHGDLPTVASHRKGHPSVPYAFAIAAGAGVALLAV
jgi:prepilin peptidase CpaA